MKFKHYISITKPGIVTGNVITAIAGFFTGIGTSLDFFILLFMIVGISGVMASACVVNNYIDRDIDRLMSRTRNRLDIYQELSTPIICGYALVLLLAGSAVLYWLTNTLTLLVALFGYFAYLFLYTLWLKRRSHWGTLAGSVSGATPPVIGYCAASGVFDIKAVALFLLLTTWQMPHFLAISLYRIRDYTNAAIPVLPVVMGITLTYRHVVYWLVFYIVTLFLVVIVCDVGWFCAFLMGVAGFFWLFDGVFKLKQGMNYIRWGRRMFLISLVNIFVISVALCLAHWL